MNENKTIWCLSSGLLPQKFIYQHKFTSLPDSMINDILDGELIPTLSKSRRYPIVSF
jgi:hypothetical protein